MSRISPVTLVIVGMILAAILGLGATVVLLAIFDTTEDAVKILAPLGTILPPLIAGLFGVLKWMQNLENRQQKRHRFNVKQIRETREVANRAAATAERAIKYHKEEDQQKDDAHLLDNCEESDAGRSG